MTNITDLSPLMQMLIKYNAVDKWLAIKENKTGELNIHSFSWAETPSEDMWRNICDELHDLPGDQENEPLTDMEMDHIEEIRDMFPEYQV